MSEVETSQDEATELEKILRSGKPWIEQNGTLLIYGLAAILAVAAVFVYLGRQPSGDIQASRDILMAVTPEEFRDVADAYPDKPIGIWARLRQADRLLDNCMTSMFSNREEGVNLLEQAETAYQRLADRTDIEDQVRERVLIGLAKVAEIKSDGSDAKTTEAIDAWKRVLSQYENSIMKDYAEDRIAKLATPESKAWYKEFSQQNPKPVDPGLSEGQPAVPALPEGMGASEGETETEGKTEGEGETEGESSESTEASNEKPDAEATGAHAAEEMPKGEEPAETPAAAENKSEEKTAAPAETVKPSEEAAKAVEEPAKPAVEKTKEAVKEATQPAADKVKEAVEKTSEAAGKASEAVKEAASDAVKKVTEPAGTEK